MPGEVYYNTADGTWWLVREAYEYLRYTGDLEFAERFLPVIERAIDGALSRRTDAEGFLLHGQAETWMDAGGEKNPFSPRGNRAVEVQVLWHTALLSGAAIADALGKEEQASRWREAAEAVGAAFLREFPDPATHGLFDHLDPDGTPDRRVRPNQMFAATVPWDDLLPREDERAMLELVRETCVLRHGVTSLHTEDPDFHPCHLDLERYHFDEEWARCVRAGEARTGRRGMGADGHAHGSGVRRGRGGHSSRASKRRARGARRERGRRRVTGVEPG
jgi:predicted glycogen debranching enzyme